MRGFTSSAFGRVRVTTPWLMRAAIFAAVDRGIDLKRAAIIVWPRFAMDQCSVDRRVGATTDDRELIIFDRDLEAVLIYPRHFELQEVAIGGLADARRRSDELLAFAATGRSSIIFTH